MSHRRLSNIFQNSTFHYVKESEDFSDIKEIIITNGGTLVSIEDIAQIKLVNSATVRDRPDGEYVDVSFLHDCVAQGEALPIEDYIVIPDAPLCIAHYRKLARMAEPISTHRAPPLEQPPTPRRQAVSSSSQNTPTRTGFLTRHEHFALSRGRMTYSEEEDFELIKFIIERHRVGMSPNGQNLWKIAEKEKLLKGLRSWQSMEGRWKKTLRNKWSDYVKLMERRGFVVLDSM